MPKLLLITFDYELFLGNKSGKVNECLIQPTDELLLMLKETGFKAVFFIDTVYLLKLGKIANEFTAVKNDSDEIYEQLKRIAAQGHYIFPHLHPHWMDAVYIPEINEWSLSNKRYYRFADIPAGLQDELFSQSVNIIKSLLPAEKHCEIDAYRAGGWCIQPFENFRTQFLRHNIKNDWSVIPGRYQYSDAHQFDFRKAPSKKEVYQFSTDPCEEDPNGEFTEWTISSLQFSRFEKWIDFKINGLRQRLHGKPAMNGSTVESTVLEEGDIFSGSGQRRITASFEGLNIFRVKKYISAIKKAGYFQFISHPKLLSRHDLKMIKRLFAALKNDEDIQTDFRKR